MSNFLRESPLESAKARLSVSVLWPLLGLPGRPAKSCRSPFRHEDDRSPSFSIFDDDHRWHDHATGEGGDSAAFLAKALGVSNDEGCKRLIAMAGVIPQGSKRTSPEAVGNGVTSQDAQAEKERAQKRANWPVFDTPTAKEINAIAALRSLSEEGVLIAAQREVLFCADSQEGRAWILTDSRRVNAQARRMDGRPWEMLSGAPKAWTLPGSIARWPIGLPEAAAFPGIALVEGGPDLLSAFHHAWVSYREKSTAVAAMLGASNWIPEDALPKFAGKRCRLFPHLDVPGRMAAKRWIKQLLSVGARVDVFDLSGLNRHDEVPVSDLNDMALVCADDWETYREVIDRAFDFNTSTEDKPCRE